MSHEAFLQYIRHQSGFLSDLFSNLLSNLLSIVSLPLWMGPLPIYGIIYPDSVYTWQGFKTRKKRGFSAEDLWIPCRKIDKVSFMMSLHILV